MADPYFETFQDDPGQWRWRLRAGNHFKIATSGESFTRREDAVRAARGVQQTAPLAKVRVPIVPLKIAPRRKPTAPQTAVLAALLAGRRKP